MNKNIVTWRRQSPNISGHNTHNGDRWWTVIFTVKTQTHRYIVRERERERERESEIESE